MKLSIVVPAYNEENYLGNCLDAILKETADHPDVEVVVVNNASTDGTEKIVLSYPSVKLVNEPRKGLVNARRAGYGATSGDIVANVDADTIMIPGWLEKVMNEFSTDDKLVALSGPFIIYDQPRQINWMVRFFYVLAHFFYLINRYIFRSSSMLQGGNYIVRRAAFDQVGGFSDDFDFYGEDTDVAHRLHKVGKVKFTFKLPIFASGRRLKGEGIVKMGWRYGLNYFWVIFFNRPFTKEQADVRP